MSDVTNLIYNGDFSHGTDSWTGNGVTASGGVLTVTGDLHQNGYFYPIANDRKYRLSFDFKVNTNDGSHMWYSCLYPYDNKRNSVINIALTNKAISGCDTTLASALNNGDTTVTLTDATKWPTNRTYQGIGICNNLAWGYLRATYRQAYTSKNGNVLTLSAAWSGGSFAAGTKVSEFEAGSTYYYPIYMSNSGLSTNWITYTKEFYGREIRNTTQYVQFHTLGYSHNYSLRNLRLECISDYQECPYYNYDVTPSIERTGIIHSGNFINVGMPIRYVRDTISGSTANSANHWNEIQIINNVGENLAWGKDVKIGSTNYSNSVVTDGVVNSSYIPSGVGGTLTAQIDLGYVEWIDQIKIWHYYPDGRTYNNNITEVSVDGTTWYTVYSGQKPETANGNIITLSPQYGSIYANGRSYFNDFIEY